MNNLKNKVNHLRQSAESYHNAYNHNNTISANNKTKIRQPTHLEITIPCSQLDTCDIPRILLNLRTYLEQPCPIPVIYQLTHDIDSNITIQQTWLLSAAGIAQGGIGMFSVCPPDTILDTSRWRRFVYGLHTVTASKADSVGSEMHLAVASVEHSREELAHNITTRKKYGVKDHGGAIINSIPGRYCRERFISWQFGNLDNVFTDESTMLEWQGLQLEVREYIDSSVFRVILKVPYKDNSLKTDNSSGRGISSKIMQKVTEKITLINKTKELQLLLHRLCYICRPL